MQKVLVNTLKKGTYFKRKEDSKFEYVSDGYCRMNKAYCCIHSQNISKVIYIKSKTEIFID